MFYVYLIQSIETNGFYIGQTDNLEKRFKAHNQGLVKSTKKDKPWRLVGFETFKTREEARWREYQLKHHSDKKKRFIKKFSSSKDNNNV